MDSLDVMLEAVEKYMGEQFTDMLAGAIETVYGEGYISGQMQSYGTRGDSVFDR